MTSGKQNSNLFDISLLRVFATLSLVLWHSYCSYVCWGYGNSPLDQLYTKIALVFIPDANMPLFTIISGFLFGYLLNKGKYTEFVPFLKNKTKRLFVPYLVLGFVINMLQIGRATPIDLLYGTPNHLWYCLMLFESFLVCWFVERKLSKYSVYINFILALLSFILVLNTGLGALRLKCIFGVGIAAYYYCYFYFGLFIERYKFFLLKYFKYLLPIVIILIAIQLKYQYVLFFSCISYFLLCFYIANLKGVENFMRRTCQSVLEIIDKCSFGIYVFHQWIIWNITRSEWSHVYIQEHYILFPIILFFSVTLISLALTRLSLKTRVGKFLLGGG